METINASDFKTRCLALLDRIQKTGERVVILKRGRPIAEPSPPHPPRAEYLQTELKGTVTVLGDYRRAGGSKRTVGKPQAMSVLLDTHVLIWSLDDHDRLSQAWEKNRAPAGILRTALSRSPFETSDGYC